MHVRFVKWAASGFSMAFLFLLICAMDVLAFVYIVKGQGQVAFVMIVGIGLVSGLSAFAAHAQACARRSKSELVEEYSKLLNLYRRRDKAHRQYIRAVDAFLDELKNELNELDANMDDPTEVFDQVHALVLDWQERSQYCIDAGLRFSPDHAQYAELLAFIEIAMEMLAPSEVEVHRTASLDPSDATPQTHPAG